MHRRPPRFLIPLLAVVALAPGSRADAVCNVSACDAAALTGNAQCCSASGCTIDGTLTVSGPSCTFDFGTRNLTVSGQVAAQGKSVTLIAKSMALTGLIDVRGPSGAAAGDVTIMTTGQTAMAYSQDGGTSAIINASSSAGPGGRVTIVADGMVSLAKGSITADGGPAATGGTIDISTTAGDVGIQIAVSASSGASAAVPVGQILVATPGNLALGGSGRLVANLGDVDLQAEGDATFAEGAVVQATGGGSIVLVAGSVTARGEFNAAGEGGAVEIRTVTGPLFLQRLSQGITVGPGVQSVALSSEASGAAGLITMDMPILAQGAEVEIESAGSVLIAKKIETTGVLDSEAGDVSIDAEDDVHVTKAIVGSDVYGEGDLTIDGRDVLIEGNLDFRGGLDASGGRVDITADRDVTLQGDIFVNVSGADFSDAGGIDIQAARNLTIGPSVELIADGSPIGSGGGIFLIAGEGFGQRLPGNLTLQGDIKANGHSPGGGAFVVIQGCDVTIPSGAVVDVTGDALANNRVTARRSLTIGGQLKATASNVLEFPEGAAVSLTGSFSPARSAGTCTGGTPGGNGCARPVCTADNDPAGCLYACPTCGDGAIAFPETCDAAGAGPTCDGLDLCDTRCRLTTCTAGNDCVNPVCDAVNGVCGFTPKADGLACDPDDNVCSGVGTCAAGACKPTPGTALQCNDDNPCTGPDTCHPVNGCQTPDRPDGPGVAGCDDGQFCTGAEVCQSGACQTGSLPCTPPQVCNAASEACENPPSCSQPTDCPDDGNPCTVRTCDAGSCGNAVTSGASCDDGNVCNGVRTCNASGICQLPTAPLVCNDGNPCTTDTCNAVSGCQFSAPAPGCCTSAPQCDDGDACTTDACVANACDHDPLLCDDGDACTADACNPASGCTATPIPACELCADASTCDDDAGPGSECTDTACVAGRCQQVPNPNCCQTNADCTDIDRNPCTDNGTCTGNRCGPVTILEGSACGTACAPGTCDAGADCVPGAPPDCSDDDACTVDVCSDELGCTHTRITGCCFGTGDCADTNVCTAETCDLDANLCDYPVPDPTCTPCVGGDPFECGPRCTTACEAGRCADAVADCDDDDPCTDDACDAAAGCTHTPRTDVAGCEECTDAACDDGDRCTTDACNADGSACVNDPATSYDAIRCRLDGMTAALDGAGADEISAKLRRRTGAVFRKVRIKIDKASAPGLKCTKARNLVRSVRAPLRKLQRTLNRAAGRQVDPALATTLATLAGETAGRAEDVLRELGC